MGSWTKNSALEELQRLIEEIDVLKRTAPFSAEHVRWQTNCYQFFKDVFGGASLYSRSFYALTFSIRGNRILPAMVGGIIAAQKLVRQEAYVDDLESAKGILMGALDHLNRVGIKKVFAGTLPKTLVGFLSFRFEGGKNYATDVKKFLEMQNITVLTAEKFEPRSISEKVQDLFDLEPDFVILIIAEDGESFWTRDEIATMLAMKKHVIPLVVKGAKFTQGLFGDLEFIPFSIDHISDTYIKLMEGIEFIRENLSELDEQ